MSTESGAQGADVSAPPSPLAPPFYQHGVWRHERYETPYSQSYDPFVSTQPQHMNSQPYRDPHFARSPYAVYGGPQPLYFPPSTFSYASHQPRLPPAIRSGPVDTPAVSSRPTVGELFPRHDPSAPRGTPQFFPSYHLGYQGLLHAAMDYSPHSISARTATMPEDAPNQVFSEGQPTPTLRGGGVEQSRQMHPLHQRPSPSNQHLRPLQRRSHQPDPILSTRNSDDTEGQAPTNPTAQGRHSDRHSSPRTSARRSFDRYSWDLPQSSTSSDVEEAAARSPPSSRVRHRPREGRPRFFHQYLDPNHSTSRQVQGLKTSLPKLLAGDLPKDTCPTCDICAKDYAAASVQPSEEEEVAVQLPCGHTFGEFCIAQWFDTCKTHKNKVTCPMCRKVLVEPPSPQYRSAYLHMYAARNSRGFQELLANELQAQYAHA
ncbi:zinc ion binding [Ascochyta rabiei]|uniref:Zinc ion binding n=2 Tax=Didymella rabiei TaxID=5454 RepID=A0A163B1L1_DIDRA|nr:zinc ion binding [Ascochyta rabiei]